MFINNKALEEWTGAIIPIVGSSDAEFWGSAFKKLPPKDYKAVLLTSLKRLWQSAIFEMMCIKSRDTVIATQLSVTVSRYLLNIHTHIHALTQAKYTHMQFLMHKLVQSFQTDKVVNGN